MNKKIIIKLNKQNQLVFASEFCLSRGSLVTTFNRKPSNSYGFNPLSNNRGEISLSGRLPRKETYSIKGIELEHKFYARNTSSRLERHSILSSCDYGKNFFKDGIASRLRKYGVAYSIIRE